MRKGIRRRWAPMTTGAFDSLSFEAYREAPGLNFSRLKRIGDCPALYERDAVLGNLGTTATRFGTLAHGAALEGERNHFYVRPETYNAGGQAKPWNGNAHACQEWLAIHADKPVLNPTEAAMVRAIADGLKTHPLAWPLIHGGLREVSLFADYAGHWCKGRADILAGHNLVDFKTVADASDDGLARAVARFKWHAQLAFYWKLTQCIGLPVREVYLVAVEKCFPPLFNVRRISEHALEVGLRLVDQWLATLEECEAAGSWPDYAGREITDLTLPPWADWREDEDDQPITMGGVPVL